MRKRIRPALIFTSIFFLAISYTMTAFSTDLPVPNTTNATFLLQTTPTPVVEIDRSEVGSTDGIVIMGGVIAAIILIPLLLQRKAWTQNDSS